jgi:murein DD-endopeptidase MepM/ murein hydrolase activator NlpD
VTLITGRVTHGAGQKLKLGGGPESVLKIPNVSVFVSNFRRAFRSRDIMIHDGSDMRRIHISARTQKISASAAAIVLAVSTFGVTQAVVGSTEMAGAISNVAAHNAEISAMERRVAALQSDVIAIKAEAKSHVARLEARQAFLASVLKGDGNAAKIAASMPANSRQTAPQATEIAALFHGLDANQGWMAAMVRKVADDRFHETSTAVARLGIAPARLSEGLAMGGPYEPVPADAETAKPAQADQQFRALFQSWKRLDQLQNSIVAIPSARPVNNVAVTSRFGIRTDPFRGGAAMHSGVDIPGPYGTPIYATADGVVGRTGWVGGYGNLIELEHGKGIQTRYGHLSSMLVTPGKRVKRGELIGLMGSTGRSTGNHLHYEVRIDGRAVNPNPFLQTSDYLLAMQRRNSGLAMGGPAEPAPANKPAEKVSAGAK